MAKKQARQRPDIQANNEYIAQSELRMCHGEGCHNAIALWAHRKFCVLCLRRSDGRGRKTSLRRGSVFR